MPMGAIFDEMVLNISVCDCHSVVIYSKIMCYERLNLKLGKKYKKYSLMLFVLLSIRIT